jgi:xylan 1,4-beta-xylosidase
MRTYELARRYGLQVEGAVTWAFEFENEPAFAGFRALATDGIDKPVLNAFRLMGMLGRGGPCDARSCGTWIATESAAALPLNQVVANSVNGAPDVNAVATRNGREVDVLLWNYHDADVAAQPASILLDLDGLGNAIVEAEFRMDATHSNAFRAWQQMGSPAHPGAEQIEQLQKAGALEQTIADHRVTVHNGKTTLPLSLPRQGLVLIRLSAR